MHRFDKKTIRLIKKWDKTLKNLIRIKLITSDHTETDKFINFTGQLTDIASRLIVESEKGEKDLPCFQLKKNLTYSALPFARELDPFLEALSQIDGSMALNLSNSILRNLEKVDIPVRLKLYVALECPHCPNVVRTVVPLAMACKNIHLQIIDGTLFPEKAQHDGVMSAPTLLLDDDFRWTGDIAAREIIEMVMNRDSSQLSSTTLKNIMEQGDASWIAGQMFEKQKLFDGFIKLLLHETWSVRLGAMVVVEELVETDPRLVAKLCPILMEQFDKKEVPVQGDILYILGETGTKETSQWINNKLTDFEHQDIIDAAREALDTLGFT
jgi:hypothetical protein